jgi:hypothetical protein
MPTYLEYGGRATAPGDFECTGGDFRSLVLEGDRRKIEQLIDAMFNKPESSSTTFRVLSRFVLMQIGTFKDVRALTPPFDEWGTVEETMLSIWVPLAQGVQKGDVFDARRLVMAVPFIWVDNPMSYAGGRETYGYPKSLGQFRFEDGVDGEMSVKTFGGDFHRNNKAGWHDVVTITREGGGQEESVVELPDAPAFVDHLSGGRLDPQGESIVDGVRFLLDAVKEARAGRSHQLFLKQFRDAARPDGACYREIIEAPIRMLRTKARFGADKWHVEIAHLDSHPICKELGVKSQDTVLSYAMEMDFVCERGKRVQPQAAMPALGG